MKGLRILHLSGSKHHWSGNEQQLADLVRHLSDMGVVNTIFCYEESAIHEYAKRHNVPTLPQPRKSVYSSSLRRTLRKIVKKSHFDVIHIHTSNFLTLYVLTDLLKRVNIPTIFSRKGLTNHAGFFSRKKYNYKNIDRIICVSGAVQKNFTKFLMPNNHAKTVVVHDGISIDTMNTDNTVPNVFEKFNLPRRKFVIGNIANHVSDKDLGTLVKTADHLINTLGQKDVVFVQMGDHTGLTQGLMDAVKRAQLRDHVFFVGKIPEAKSYMPQFDLFLMTSCSEGLPLTVYEAFMYKIPVVTTCAGGIPEAVKDGHSGIMTEIGDHISLAKGISKMMNDSTLRERIADNAHTLLLKNFTARQCAERTLSLYKEIIKK